MCPWSRARPGGLKQPQQRPPVPLFQVLKSQRWEKKQAVVKVLGTNEMHQPSAEVGRDQGRPPHPGIVWGRKSPESQLCPCNISFSDRTRSLQRIQHQASSLGPRHPQPVPAWSQQSQSVGPGTHPTAGWRICGHRAWLYTVGKASLSI